MAGQFVSNLRTGASPRALTGPFGPSVGLEERDSELARLSEAFADARGGRGSILVLEGPAGSGKSSVLQAGRVLASEEGLEPLSAAGCEAEREFTFGVALQLFESRLDRADEQERGRLLSGAARLAAPLLVDGPRDGLPEEGQAFSLLHGLYRLCANLAEQRPLTLFVDDSHWVDAPTLRFLLYLTQRVEELPVTVVLAAQPVRRNGAGDLLTQIVGHPSSKRMRLLPLSGEAVARSLRASHFPGAHDAFCRACHRATGGNPLLLDQLARELASTGVAPTAEAAASVGEVGPEEIAASTLQRVGELGPGAVELAQAVAVLGDSAELRHAARLAELDVVAAARLANALSDTDVFANAERLSFVYPIVRRAVHAEHLAADRAEAHLHAAELLHAESMLPERVAAHLLLARRSGSAWVVDALRAAAGQALARGAPGIAARYLRRALDEPPDADLRAQVVLELGRAEATAGEPGAVDRLSQASELIEDPRQRARTALDAGRTLHAQGRQEEAARAFERGFEDVRGVDAELAGRLRAADRAVARLSVVGPQQEPARVPKARGQDSQLDRLACAEAAFAKALAGGPREEVLDLASRALGNGALLDAETADGPSYYLAATSYTVAEDVQTAEAALTAAVENARLRGSVLGYATASSFRAWAILSRGRVDYAAADAETALAGARYGWRLGLPDAHAVLAEVLIERGDLDGAACELDLAGRRLRDPGGARRHVFLATRGHLRLLRGQPAEALLDYVECGRLLEEGGVLNPAVLPWRSGAAVACAALGHTDDARHYAERELELAKGFGAPGPVGRALSTLGSVIGGDRGLEPLHEAVEVLRGSQAVLLRARALVDYGSALRRSGKLRASREPLREGLDLAKRLGARALARRAQEEVRAAGGRPRRTALQGIESLTPREHQVADLAAQGKSNREIAEALFVTQKTVEWHLRNGYEKLGVASRRELRPALAGNTEND